MSWRLAGSLVVLRAEIDAAFPHRSKVSDGTIGDAAHASRVSDHNPQPGPNGPVVRAFDCTAIAGDHDPARVDGAVLAEHVRQLGLAGHPALQNHGYVIWDGRSAYASSGWVWGRYTGLSPHREHVHVSVGREPAQYDDARSWAIGTPPHPTDPEEQELMAAKEEILEAIGQVRAGLLGVVRPPIRLVHAEGEVDGGQPLLWATDGLTFRRKVGGRYHRFLSDDFAVGPVVELAAADRDVLYNIPEVTD